VNPNGGAFVADINSDGLSAFNYNSSANTNDGSCYPIVFGCMDSLAFNFNDLDGDNLSDSLMGEMGVDINTDDGSCYAVVYGCIDSTAFNYNDYDNDNFSNTLSNILGLDVNTDDGSCYQVVEGCTDSLAFNYNDYDNDNFSDILTGILGLDVNTDDGSCYQIVEGCMNELAFNYNDIDGDGFSDSLTNILGVDINTDDGSCVPISIGCMNPNASNYEEQANVDNGSCIVEGCTDSIADNFNPEANTLTYCDYTGCMNEYACNYLDIANISSECIYPDAFYNCDSVCLSDIDSDGICDELEIYGCTDTQALNFDSLATEDNNSCFEELQVTYVVNDALCFGGYGSINLQITGGKAPIEINSFGVDLNQIPPGEGYLIYISDASGLEYSFGGQAPNFIPSFDIHAPEIQIEVELDYDEGDQEISFSTNSEDYNFAWYVNDELDLSLDTEQITNIQNGLYALSFVDEYGCEVYLDTLILNVGLDELQMQTLEIYPNPSEGIVNISYELNDKSLSRIRLISITGEILRIFDMESKVFVEKSINLSDLNAGIYLIEIESKKQTIRKRILLK
jgi:hypothetical protein